MPKKVPDPAKLDDKTVQHIRAIQSEIGALISAWATVESAYIGVLRKLLGVDNDTAVIVFYSIGTGRGRLMLIERLLHLRLNGEVKETALNLLKRFKSGSRLRNELAHAEYEFPMIATHVTQLDGYTGGKPVKRRMFDKARRNEVTSELRKLLQLNQDIIDFLPILEAKLK